MGKRIEEFEKPKAKSRQKDHGRTAPGKTANTSGNLPEVKGETRSVAAEAVGMSPRTYDKAKAVVNAASQPDAPPAVREAARQMDLTGKVDPAFKAVKAAQPTDEDRKSRGVGIQRAHEAIACLKRIPENDGLRKQGFQVVADWIRHNQ